MDEKKAFTWGFSGNCAPMNSCRQWETFSVGIFQWLPKTSGKGLKKGAVKYRVKGPTSNPNLVYDKARVLCELLNNGQTLEKRYFQVGLTSEN